MKIALVGYGKMGKEIQNISKNYPEYEITKIINRGMMGDLLSADLESIDVAIDFTNSESVLDNIKILLKLNIPVVVGTTGWSQYLEEVENLVKEHKGSLIYGQNFSVGANVFFNIIENATREFSRFPNYDIFGIETHHSAKKDSPSGTANKISEIILKNSNKNKIINEKLDRKIEYNELHFASVRGGSNRGRHEVVFDSEDDEIRIIHQARSRSGFAYGALLAAKFIKDNKGFYEFSSVFDQIEK